MMSKKSRENDTVNVKNIKLTIKDKKQVLKEFAEALGKVRRREELSPHHETSFENIDVLRRVLTEKRLQLLHTIKKHTPESIYELAKTLNRDLKSVTTDIQILKDMGLISLKTTHEARKKTKPTVTFDKLDVEITI